MKKLIVILTVLALVMPALADKNYIGAAAPTLQSMSDAAAWDGGFPVPNESSHFGYDADLLVDGDFGMVMRMRDSAGVVSYNSDGSASLLSLRELEAQKGGCVVDFFGSSTENYLVGQPTGNTDDSGDALTINAYAGADGTTGMGAIHFQKRNDSNPWNGDFEDPKLCNFDRNKTSDMAIVINADLMISSRNNQGPSGNVIDKGKDMNADGMTVKDDLSAAGRRKLTVNGDMNCYTTDMTTDSNEFKGFTVQWVDFAMNGDVNSGLRRINVRHGAFLEMNGTFTGQQNPVRNETWEANSTDENGGTSTYIMMTNAGLSEQDARATYGGNGTIDDTAELRLDGAGAINAGTRGTVGALSIKQLKLNQGTLQESGTQTVSIGSYVETDIIGTNCDLIIVRDQLRLEHDDRGLGNKMLITFEFNADDAKDGTHTFIDYANFDDQDGWLNDQNAASDVYVVIIMDGVAGTPQKMAGYQITTTEGWTIDLKANGGTEATVTITGNPDCVAPDGDISSAAGEGITDCMVDLFDLATLAKYWLVDNTVE